jgi:antitoxin PrlF
MQFSKVTSKYQATVPADVRAALGIQAGDTIAWDVKDGVATMRVVPRGIKGWDALTWHSFSEEWLSSEDEEAFRDL